MSGRPQQVCRRRCRARRRRPSLFCCYQTSCSADNAPPLHPPPTHIGGGSGGELPAVPAPAQAEDSCHGGPRPAGATASNAACRCLAAGRSARRSGGSAEQPRAAFGSREAAALCTGPRCREVSGSGAASSGPTRCCRGCPQEQARPTCTNQPARVRLCRVRPVTGSSTTTRGGGELSAGQASAAVALALEEDIVGGGLLVGSKDAAGGGAERQRQVFDCVLGPQATQHEVSEAPDARRWRKPLP